jgi:hypothetical protein
MPTLGRPPMTERWFGLPDDDERQLFLALNRPAF